MQKKKTIKNYKTPKNPSKLQVYCKKIRKDFYFILKITFKKKKKKYILEKLLSSKIYFKKISDIPELEKKFRKHSRKIPKLSKIS